MTEENKFERPHAEKYDYKNPHLSGVPATNVLGVAGTLPCIATAKGNTKICNNQEGSDTNLSELSLATALEPGLQSPAGYDRDGCLGIPQRVARVFGGEGNPGAWGSGFSPTAMGALEHSNNWNTSTGAY